MNTITAYYPINDTLACSGQPTEEQFSEIAAAGFQAVINVAMPTSTNAIANECQLVTQLGMTYIHIPVSWEAPRVNDVILFFDIMQALTDKKVWLHCALNMRASCFIYLYKKFQLQLNEDDARFPMNQIWEPKDKWLQLINDIAARYQQKS